jgi:hypothetical protein
MTATEPIYVEPKQLTLREELAIIDRNLRKRRLKAVHVIRLQAKREKLLKKMAKEQRVVVRDGRDADGRPISNQERFLNSLDDPFKREFWEHVFRIEAENRANAQAQPEPQQKTVIPPLPEGVAIYGPGGREVAATTQLSSALKIIADIGEGD